jgi:anti-anti-sigma factor
MNAVKELVAIEERRRLFRASVHSFQGAEGVAWANALIIELAGDIDSDCAPELTRVFQEALNETLLQHLVLDMQNVSHFDSTCIGILLKMYNLLKRRDGSLHLFAVNKNLRRVMTTLNITRLLLLHETKVEVLEALRKRAETNASTSVI